MVEVDLRGLAKRFGARKIVAACQAEQRLAV